MSRVLRGFEPPLSKIGSRRGPETCTTPPPERQTKASRFQATPTAPRAAAPVPSIVGCSHEGPRRRRRSYASARPSRTACTAARARRCRSRQGSAGSGRRSIAPCRRLCGPPTGTLTGGAAIRSSSSTLRASRCSAPLSERSSSGGPPWRRSIACSALSSSSRGAHDLRAPARVVTTGGSPLPGPSSPSRSPPTSEEESKPVFDGDR
jgi:hypothetical protein